MNTKLMDYLQGQKFLQALTDLTEAIRQNTAKPDAALPESGAADPLQRIRDGVAAGREAQYRILSANGVKSAWMDTFDAPAEAPYVEWRLKPRERWVNRFETCWGPMHISPEDAEAARAGLRGWVETVHYVEQV